MIKESELVLNPDGSVYHLKLLPEHVADYVITVGDPERIDRIAKHLTDIEVKIHNREFYTITGSHKKKRITAISTGIGPDNIDIVINELDVLRRFDLKTGQRRKEVKPYTIIRLGTCGTAQSSIPVGSFIASIYAVGLDNLLHFYDYKEPQSPLRDAIISYLKDYFGDKILPVFAEAHPSLVNKLDEQVVGGITVTCPGFYGPQGRAVSLQPRYEGYIDKISEFEYDGLRLTNFEMETSAIYGLAQMLGHRALSLNTVIANRANGTFSEDKYQDVENLITYGLSLIDKM